MSKKSLTTIVLANTRRMMQHGAWIEYSSNVFAAAAQYAKVLFQERSFTEHGDANCCILIDIPETDISALRDDLTYVRQNHNGSRITLVAGEVSYI